jgi:glycine cleavage system H protein
VKTTSELFIPVSGEVIAVNDQLVDAPELVNHSPYEEGWMIKVRVDAQTEIDALLTATEYEDFVASQSKE